MLEIILMLTAFAVGSFLIAIMKTGVAFIQEENNKEQNRK